MKYPVFTGFRSFVSPVKFKVDIQFNDFLMKAFFGFMLVLLFPLVSAAQKNVIPTSQITALNLSLPDGAKQDKRFLITVAAATLLETEVHDPNIKLTDVEVFFLPPASKSGFDGDVLINNLEKSGFQILPTKDERMAWLIKKDASYLIYFSMDKAETSFYVAKSNMPPKPQNQITNSSSQTSDSQSGTMSVPVHIPPLPASRTASTPSSVPTQPQSSTPKQTPPIEKPLPPVINPAPLATFSGYQFSTSNFDDGWVASIQPDWVLVQKGDTKVYLFFVLPYQSENFDGTGVRDRDYYWDNHIAPLFKTNSKSYQDGGEFISSMQPKYVEGWGADPHTGQSRFIGMFLTVSPNAAMLTVASAASEAGLRQIFPRAADRWDSDLVRMSSYNKFAVGPNDLNGTWQSGGSQMTQWYNSVTGAYAGATFASSSATFSFAGNTYSSIHNGATGAVGAMNTFQQEYKGNATITNWNITMTNRYQGKTQQFDSHFQAVRGGRLLYLNDRSGGEYTLVKIK